MDLTQIDEFDEDGIFRPEKLALVHVTNYMPQKADDHYEIQSTAEALDYLYPRNTIHFTIGHHVDSHLWGAWDDKGIMIVASLKETIDNNDKPLGMSSFDTYFETTPGQNLKLPPGTHLFIPTSDPEKLGDKLTHTEGDITYYKNTNFTDKEKDRIFSGARLRGNTFGSDKIFVGVSTGVNKEQFKYLSNGVISFELKKNLLYRYLEQQGYVANHELSNWAFNKQGSAYAQNVSNLGKKLGCRFYTSGNQGHFNNDFTSEPIVSNLFQFMRYADFILHPDEYEIASSKSYGKHKKYEFKRKDGKGLSVDVEDPQSDKEKGYIQMLKKAPDFTIDMKENQEENGDKWSPAFRETYDMWMKKTSKRLKDFYEGAKNCSFDEILLKIRAKMKEFDLTKGGLLTRAFARAAKSPERQEKAEGLLKILRERDMDGREITVKEYKKRFVDKIVR